MTHNPAQRAQIAAIRDLIGRGWSRADVRALSVYQTDLADEAFRLECRAERAITATTCLDCKKRTRMVGFFQEYYGWHSTCLRCGRQWDGGEWLPLDFRRGVRSDNINGAKARWRNLAEREALS